MFCKLKCFGCKINSDDGREVTALVLFLSVVRGYIRNISHDPVRQTSVVEVAAARVYRQRSGAFELHPSASPPSWRGHILTPLRCGVKPGDGAFLFTGSEHFGEVWLGCAPRYKDFLSANYKARRERRNYCDFP